jgi:deazaflavin-dependent oxidoreductase (nitroreductase family)
MTDQLPTELPDEECCYLTTVGRRTRRPHEIEIWYGVIGRTIYLISGNGPGADWYRNALAAPTVMVRIGATTLTRQARPVTDATERRAVGDLMGAKYPWDGDPSIGLTFDAWCYDVPVLALD